MNRYIVQTNLIVPAKNKKEAQRIMKEIIESGSAMGSEGSKIAIAKLNEKPQVIEKLAF